MYEIADALPAIRSADRVVRVVSLQGFGSRHGGEAVAIDADGAVVAGGILAGLADLALSGFVGVGTLDVAIADPDAEAAGMACGGAARLVVQTVASIPESAWAALQRRHPVVLVTDLADTATIAVTDDAIAAIADDAVQVRAEAALRAGRATSEVVDGRLVEAYLPPTTVRIVGHAGVGDALAAQAALLGWNHATVDGVDSAVGAAQAQRAHDALVILSRDETIDTAALAVALDHGRGYIGALGSRGTQAARRDRLAALGFDAATIETIHGPVGLDLGSRTPAETAVAIVAEIIAFRSGRSARSLAGSDGPING